MNRPYIWAHRGADGYAPENTLPAFAMAAQMGADGVELDVHLTKDGYIVVCHDERIDRTSNGRGWLKDLTLKELKTLDFSGGDNNYNSVTIPTLEEVLELLRSTGMYVNIELKTEAVPYPGIEKKCIELIKKSGYEDRVIFSSFNHLSLQRIKLTEKEMKTGYLYFHTSPSIIPFIKKLGADAIIVMQSKLLSPELLEKCREYGIEIDTWTINKKSELKICADNGVNAVITDYPDQIRQFLDELGLNKN